MYLDFFCRLSSGNLTRANGFYWFVMRVKYWYRTILLHLSSWWIFLFFFSVRSSWCSRAQCVSWWKLRHENCWFWSRTWRLSRWKICQSVRGKRDYTSYERKLVSNTVTSEKGLMLFFSRFVFRDCCQSSGWQLSRFLIGCLRMRPMCKSISCFGFFLSNIVVQNVSSLLSICNLVYVNIQYLIDYIKNTYHYRNILYFFLCNFFIVYCWKYSRLWCVFHCLLSLPPTLFIFLCCLFFLKQLLCLC